MITNQKQYKVTQTHLKEFEAALAERKRGSAPDGIDEGMWQLEQDALESQIEDFKADLSAFENLQAGKIVETNLNSLADLPVLLIQARIAQGLTQKEFADKLEVKEQQVQKDEASLYESASLHRLMRIVEVLGLEFQGQARLPVQR